MLFFVRSLSGARFVEWFSLVYIYVGSWGCVLMLNDWFVYVIETECGALYTGITMDVERRFSEHQGAKDGNRKGAKYFRGRSPRRVVYTEACEGRSAASKREYEIKAMSRRQKLALISSAV